MIRRGDVVLVNLDPVVGSEQGKVRPAVVIQNDIGNELSPVTIIAPITTKLFSREFPTNVALKSEDCGLKQDSTILLNQIRTIDKSRIIKRVGFLRDEIVKSMDIAIKISLGLE